MSVDERVEHDANQVRRRTITRRTLFGAAALAVAGGVTDRLLPHHSAPSSTPATPHGAGIHVADHSGTAVELVADVTPVRAVPGDIDPIARAQQQFALDLIRATTSPANLVLSPTSLATALTMIQLGARGRTAAEIGSALHTATLSPQQQAAGWSALTQSMAAASGPALESANAVWQQRGLAVQRPYLADLTRYFQAGVWQVDFGDMTAALSAIDAWVREHTHDKITKLFDRGDLDPSTVLVLANAEYFAAAWKYRFDPQRTHQAPFHRADGSTVSVPFMVADSPLSMTSTSRYFAAQLPYAGGRFAAQLIMPIRGSLADLTAALTPDDLHAIGTRPAGSDSIDLLVPKFTAQTYAHLDGTLQQLGIRTAYTSAADFSAMSTTPLQLGTVVQRDYLKVDEDGTEAAAVTGGGMIATAAPVGPPPFDRPFLFLVRDTRTGTVLFAGQIQDPSAA